MNRWSDQTVEPKQLKATSVIESRPLTVESFDNHLYFYSEVNTDRCLDLMQRMRGMDAQLRNERLNRDLPPDFPAVPIFLHINSGGGDVFTAFAVADQMARIASPVYTVVEGYCASAATILSLAGNKRYIQPNAYMLIHEFSSFVWGKFSDFEDDMVLQRDLMARMVAFYAAHTRLKKREISKRLKHDFWLTPEQALADGFVDAIVGKEGEARGHGTA